MRKRLASGDHEFLREIDFSHTPAVDAVQLGEGAPFFLALAFQSLGLQPQARRLLELQVAEDDGTWTSLALPPLLEILLDRSDYAAAIRLATQYLRSSHERLNRDLIRKSLVEAIYWSGDDGATLKALAEQFPDGGSAEQPELNPELALFRAVASSRQGVPGWQDLFLRLCLHYPASSVHLRAWQFFEQQKDLQAALPSGTRALLQAKASLASSEPAAALAPLESGVAALEGGPEPTLIREAMAAYLAAGEATRGARFLETLARPLAGSKRLAGLEAAGRLYRAAGAMGKATSLLREVADSTPDPSQRDRALWYLAEIASRGSDRAALAELSRSRGSWSRPSYFDDLVDRLTTRFLDANDLRSLEALFAAIGGAEIPSRIRLYYILYRLGDRSLPAPESVIPERPATILEDYYRLMLGDPQPVALPAPAGGSAGGAAPPDSADLDFLMSGFVDFGLYDRAMDLARKSPRRVSRAARIAASKRMAAEQRYRDAISLVGNGFPWDDRQRETTPVAYPRAYDAKLTSLARRESIDEAVAFAMVREESAFDPQVISSAGAVGLTQLLPDTASEEARRMRLRSYDLGSADDNLSIGFHYLGRLVRLEDSLVLGLAAYNAGLTRVRQWKKQYARLPADLMLEAIPFEETRHYVRKILVSTAVYAALYDGVGPERSVELFFPSHR